MSRRIRELSREERLAIRKLVTEMCANYQREYGCLPLEGACYMLLKVYTGAYCRYFREAVLPLNPALESALTGRDISDMRRLCPVCGAEYIAVTCQAYCSEKCKKEGNRRKSRERMRKRRKNRG